MKFVIFGLTISSAWGNGHATLWRGLCRALQARGHRVVFYERDVPYYAAYRDAANPAGCDLRLYDVWDDAAADARSSLAGADVAMVTSYCPDGRAASNLVLDSDAALKVFYDLDTPVTLARVGAGETVSYLPEEGLGAFDLVLSYTGGRALDELRNTLRARIAVPLYGSVDPEVHRPAPKDPLFESHLSYIGTYSADRQDRLERLFLEPARRRVDRRFALAGSQYPQTFDWPANVFYFSHLVPSQHCAFYGSSGLTLNVTRAPMADMGYCPSGRLFEAAACGAAILTDTWDGLEEFFEPGREILTAATTADALSALALPEDTRRDIGAHARARALDCHTADRRAAELESILEHAGAVPVASGFSQT